MKKNYFNVVLAFVMAFANVTGMQAKVINATVKSLEGNTFKIILFAGINTPPAAPVITSFTPSSGPVGALVTITGTDLSTPTVLTIGGVTAIPVSNDGTTLVAMVMPGATSGTIGITTGSGSATSSASFSIVVNVPPAAQQGAKLVGTGGIGTEFLQGFSVSLSADGATAIVGAPKDNFSQGAVWIYIRSGSIWSQQTKLVSTEHIGPARQGQSVSLSADGNTAIVGGYFDNSSQGAAWVYTRNAGVWSQQGAKLVGTDAIGNAGQGWSVSLSADGNTAIIGGLSDNANQGAAWVFTRSVGIWSQQGTKLVGTGAIGNAIQGRSVSLSADGNTALVGGNSDNANQGAAWVFTRSGTTWSQQGSKLVGTGAIGNAQQGYSVSLSADGNTVMVGGSQDNAGQGAVWLFTRSAGVWSQQGTKLVGTGSIDAARQGLSVSLSADGNTAIVGGYLDNGGGGESGTVGAAWVYNGASSSLGIDTNIIKGFAMYPNPVNEVLNISAQETIKSVQVYNILGQQVAQKLTNSDKAYLDISKIATGTYFVKITTDKTTKSVKLIKY